jgi:hypothetical protein
MTLDPKITNMIRMENDCWIWTGFHNRGRPIYRGWERTGDVVRRPGGAVDRITFTDKYGEDAIKKADRLFRDCGNRSCVNPDHMIRCDRKQWMHLGRRDDSGLPDRILSHIHKTEGCWTWTGCLSTAGYGRTSFAGEQWYVHRLMYQEYVGPLDPSFEIDHKCRNTKCVKPDHLQQVEHSLNTQNLRRNCWQQVEACAAGNPAATHRLIVSIPCHPRDMLICPACADVYFAFISEALSHRGLYRCRDCPEIWPIETTTVVPL